jgi:hypothetical protein
MTFTHAELVQIWTALQQYADNHDPPEAGEPDTVPADARTALAKLDTYMAAPACCTYHRTGGPDKLRCGPDAYHGH